MLTIIGVVEAVVLPLQTVRFGASFPKEGETRAVVREASLCLGVRFPETGRLAARSTSRNTVW